MRLLRHITFLLLLPGMGSVWAQNEDTPQVPGLDLFLDASAEDYEAAEAKVLALFASVEHRVARINNPHRKADMIFRLVRKATFRHYQYIADMDQLVQKGVFNCVSSTALLAMAYAHFGIEFEIREQPNHVYLYARTGKHWARVETTVEDFGLIREKKKPLREAKNALGNDPVSRRSDGKAAMERKIGLSQLAGLQHYNRGLQYMDAEAVDLALEAFVLARELYPCTRIAEMTIHAAELLKAKGFAQLLAEERAAAFPLLSAAAEVLPEDAELRRGLLAAVLEIAGSQPDTQAAHAFLSDCEVKHPSLNLEPWFRESLDAVGAR